MPENTLTSEERAKMIADFDKEKGIQKVPSSSVTQTVIAAPIVQREIKPKDFPALMGDMPKFRSRTIIMSYADVADYCGFAHELYERDEDTKTVPLDEKWQRNLENKRVNEAALYLNNDTHYFPAIVCVPRTSNDCVFVDGHVTIGKAGILVLDGQHRVGAIKKAVTENAALEHDTVTVIILEIADITLKRQIFADINRSPKKVSKALNLAFDTSDRVARICKSIINYEERKNDKGELDENGQFVNKVLKNFFDEERVTPLAKSHHMMSLTNLCNLVGPMSKVVDDKNQPVLSEVQLREVVQTIVDNMPDNDRLRRGSSTFENVRKEFVFCTSTIWQALGNLLEERIKAKDEKGNPRINPSEFAGMVKSWILRLRDTGSWKLTSEVWADKNRLVVINGTSVGTQRGYVKNATDVLRDLTASIN